MRAGGCALPAYSHTNPTGMTTPRVHKMNSFLRMLFREGLKTGFYDFQARFFLHQNSYTR